MWQKAVDQMAYLKIAKYSRGNPPKINGYSVESNGTIYENPMELEVLHILIVSEREQLSTGLSYCSFIHLSIYLSILQY
jgi:hypothetical protein